MVRSNSGERFQGNARHEHLPVCLEFLLCMHAADRIQPVRLDRIHEAILSCRAAPFGLQPVPRTGKARVNPFTW